MGLPGLRSTAGYIPPVKARRRKDFVQRRRRNRFAEQGRHTDFVQAWRKDSAARDSAEYMRDSEGDMPVVQGITAVRRTGGHIVPDRT